MTTSVIARAVVFAPCDSAWTSFASLLSGYIDVQIDGNDPDSVVAALREAWDILARIRP